MESEQGSHKVSLPRDPRTAGQWREAGLRSVRRLSNWTVAALVVGVGGTTAVLAKWAQPTASTTAATTATGSAASAGTPSGSAAQGGAPSLHAPVTLTTPSGVVIQSAATGGAVGGTAGAAGGGSATPGARRVVYGGDT